MDAYCYECGKDLADGEGVTLDLEFWVFAPDGAESKETRPTRLCDEDGVLFAND